MPIKMPVTDETPLGKLSCDHAECDNGLHCFGVTRSKALAKKRALKGNHPNGTCQECGAALVNWERVRTRESGDVENTFSELRKEWIRHFYFHVPFDAWAVNYARRLGRAGLRERIPRRLRSALRVRHPREGRQTPWGRNVIYYAQHATATCCRHCLEYWHGVPLDHPLAAEELTYFSELCLRYVLHRMPELPDVGCVIAGIRKGS